MGFQKKINELTSNPRKLFLIDGLGAILSAFLLVVVLVKLESLFGIPQDVLYILAFLPCLFAGYDFYCYFKNKENLDFYLKGIAIANILYCCLSIGFVLFHYKSVTVLGWIYIVSEIVIVLVFASIELKVAGEYFKVK